MGEKLVYGTLFGQPILYKFVLMRSFNVCKIKKLLLEAFNILRFILFFLIISSSNMVLSQDSTNVLSHGIKTIVIDPGHGGHDPGCHGKDTHEKEVALAIGLKLGEFIKEKYPHIKVVYTRSTDVFVELDERAKIANTNKADLFVCIHANAASAKAKGVETFVLGLHRTESQQKIAERENATIYLEKDNGEKYKDFDMSPDAIIARQIQLSVFLDQSISFASKVQRQFAGIGRFDRGVKQAGFLVLYKTTMPSVLIETGFLTNVEEEKFLKDTLNQQKMANSIFKAFQEYKSEIEGVNIKVTDANSYIKDTIKAAANKPVVEKKPEVKTPNVESFDNSVVYRVQVETSKTKIPLTDARFKGYTVFEYKQDGLYKYTVGVFKDDMAKANSYKSDLRKVGFDFAFVVAFYNDKRITIEEARKLSK